MAVSISLIEKAYNAIYDYLINKCDNREFYEAWLKHGIKSSSKSSIQFSTNELYDVMIDLQEAIKKHVAEEKGTGCLRKAMLNVLKRTSESRPLLQKAYVEDGWTMVCDSWVLIRVKRDVDIPKHDADTKWLNWEGIIPNDINSRREIQLPTVKEMKEYIKLNASNDKCNIRHMYGKKKTIFYDIVDSATEEILARVEANFLLDVLQAFEGTDYRCYYKSQLSNLYFENTEGECAVVCPMRID